ncbi:DUF11 domain-containing protein [Nitratireductor sp. B36]|uniref:DUF7507 domain-containing protein n=1 Tax=Nitratireductor sp. B36 TaxID=2762059 RepID=UPI001E46767B|nr:DUF11 domain-containing protein [Nitratireductor sp. B36]MCC5779583.1 DUF11 domain-containing protein [Nitratireductor sp. B36]
MRKIIRSSIFDFKKLSFFSCFWVFAILGGFLGVPGGGADAQTLPDFGTCDSRMWLSQGTQTSLNAIDTSTNPFTFVNQGSVSFTYNGTAYNPLDNYGYAVNNNSPTLYRIGSNAQLQNLGNITGLPSGFKANTGEISDDGSYYIYSRTHDNSLYKVDISATSATRIPLSRSVFLTDLAWSNGLLYAKEGDSRQLISINPVTGAVINIGDTGLAASSLFGAMFGTPNTVYGSGNSGEGFFEFDTATGRATRISNSPGSSINDGMKCATTILSFPADIAISKTDGKEAYISGEDVTYAITVVNNGPFGATDIGVDDPLPAGVTEANWTCFGLNGGVCDAASGTGALDNQTASLPVGGVVTYNLTISIPPDHSGDLINTATLNLPDTIIDNSPEDNSDTDTDLEASMSIVKAARHVDANGNGKVDIGEEIVYDFTVENTGGATLTDIEITDSKVRIEGNPILSLAPGASDSETVKGYYTVTEADLIEGKVDNLASGSAKGPDGQDVTAKSRAPNGNPGDPTSIETPMEGDYDFVKEAEHVDANGNGRIDAGETISYKFIVENTGNVPLTDIVVTDSRATIEGSPLAGPLEPGAKDEESVKGTYVVTQDDVDAGDLDNVADSTAKLPTGDDVTKQSRPPGGDAGDPTRPPGGLEQETDYDVVKRAVHDDANGNGRADVGEEIKYDFTVTNTGNTTLTNVEISDPKAEISGSPTASLAPGQIDSDSVKGVHKITEEDLAAGSVENVALATAKGPNGEDVNKQSRPPDGQEGDATRVETPLEGDYDFVKQSEHEDANGNGLIDAGEVIRYRFTIENTGNVSLTDIVVTDARARVEGSPLAGPLAPGQKDEESISGTYEVTQADIDAGDLDNLATSNAKLPNGVSLSKQSRPPGGEAGEPTLPPGGLETVSDYDLVKKAEHIDANGNGFADAGEVIEYTFTAVNTGNVTLSNIAVTDDKAEIKNSPIASLAPGQSDSNVTAEHVITQEDIDEGSFSNNATAVAQNPKGEDVVRYARPPGGRPGDPTTVPFETIPSVELELSGEWIDTNSNGFPDPGEPIQYSFSVRNTGNTTLEDLAIDSIDWETSTVRPAARAASVYSGLIPALKPGAELDSLPKVSYPITQADIDAGGVAATTRISGRTRDGTVVSDTSDDPNNTTDEDLDGDGEPDDPNYTPLLQVSALGLKKSGVFEGTAGRLAKPGDTILYTLTATNEGNLTVSNVRPADPGPRFGGQPGSGSFTPFSPASADLAAGETKTFTATYTLTQRDIDAAEGLENGIQNSAKASGRGADGREVFSPVAGATVVLPGYAIGKTTPLAEVRRGDRVPYTITVKQLGSAGGSAVKIIDMTPAGLTFARGSAKLNGNSAEPLVEGRRLTFENVTLSPGEAAIVELDLVVTGAAKPGEYVNKAWVETTEGAVVSRIATAVVEVVVEAVFDCGDIIGKVFDDRNRNGYQEEEEPGLPGVRLATIKGLLLTSDAQGRFHIACADLPDQRIGTNYILKLDPRSLPSGYRLTTENPRVVRLTAGKGSEFLFGATIGRVVRLDLTDAAFLQGSARLNPEWERQINQMIVLLDQEPSVLRLIYTGSGDDTRMAVKRLREIRRMVSSAWGRTGRGYHLEIETRFRPQNAKASVQNEKFE